MSVQRHSSESNFAPGKKVAEQNERDDFGRQAKRSPAERKAHETDQRNVSSSAAPGHGLFAGRPAADRRMAAELTLFSSEIVKHLKTNDILIADRHYSAYWVVGTCWQKEVENGRPGFEGFVGGEDDSALFVAPADDLEEQIGAVFVDGHEFDLINDGTLFSQRVQNRNFSLVCPISFKLVNCRFCCTDKL